MLGQRLIVFVLALGAVGTTGFLMGRAIDVSPTHASAGPELQPAVTAADADALSDGLVTAEEYRAAFDRDVACRVSSGARVVGPVTQDRFGYLGVQMERDGSSEADARAALEAAQTCHRQYLDAVQLAWSRGHGPTPQDYAEARALTSQCLVAAGYDISSSPAPNEIHDRFIAPVMLNDSAPMPGVNECLQKTADEMKWPGYWGN